MRQNSSPRLRRLAALAALAAVAIGAPLAAQRRPRPTAPRPTAPRRAPTASRARPPAVPAPAPAPAPAPDEFTMVPFGSMTDLNLFAASIPSDSNGSLDGAALGDAFGYGGLGATGTGWGGGGTGEGTIGLGSIGTLGHGSGMRGVFSALGAHITNTQEEGVDEGDIVKAHGDHLVVLRRGRLFTLRVTGGRATPVAMLDAFPPGAQPASWYDEMLVHDDTVVVLGYRYEDTATEINLFRIDAAGRLAFDRTFDLRSGDYYSSRNYATRLVGHRLVIYTPINLQSCALTPQGGTLCNPHLPAMRTARTGPWRTIANPAGIYRPMFPAASPVLHTVLTCDLANPAAGCSARGVVGSSARSFYVSQGAVYLWVDGGQTTVTALTPMGTLTTRRRRGAVLYRFPFDATATPGAALVAGGPIDQFSFSERGGELRAVVAREGTGGDGMWHGELPAGPLALARVPLAAFGLTARALPASQYTALPAADGGNTSSMQNRFIEDRLVYGSGSTWWNASGGTIVRRVYVHDPASRATTTLQLAHGVDRIEPLGRDAVVVGTDGHALHFTSLALDAAPTIADHYARPDAAQGETRSHGFFYLPSDGDARTGMLGLPVRRGGDEGWRQLRDGAAGVDFLQVVGLRFARLGTLAAHASNTDDACRASCVDWYGNARPIFYGGRIFALLGYELVEGALVGTALREVARTDMLTPHRNELARR